MMNNYCFTPFLTLLIYLLLNSGICIQGSEFYIVNNLNGSPFQKNDSLINLIEKREISELPIGEKNIFIFKNPITIIPNGKNDLLKDSIYCLNKYYNFGIRQIAKNYAPISLSSFDTFPRLFYYDIEVVSSTTKIIDSLTFLVGRFPDLNGLYLFLTKEYIESENQKDSQELLTIYTYNNFKKEIIDGLNILYEHSLSYNYKQPVYKSFNSGFVKKYFYINKDYIISLFYFDDILEGESEEYRFLKKEDWQIKPNGKFARHYNTDGYFQNNEEKGQVKNHMREGKWIETKPNGMVNKLTYLEASFKEGEPTGLWKFYSYEGSKKGKLLYTESYKDGKLEERRFSDK